MTLRNGYFGLFGAPAYLVSDQGKAFTGHLITHLCELYGVHKLRTSPYHAQTNGQVERMNQTIIQMIGKLAEDNPNPNPEKRIFRVVRSTRISSQ